MRLWYLFGGGPFSSACQTPTTTVRIMPPANHSPLASKADSLSRSTSSACMALVKAYADTTPARTKALDAYLVFLACSGAFQLFYCFFISSFPFNAFVGGFGSCIGQFVLAFALRMQTSPQGASEYKHVSHERFVFVVVDQTGWECCADENKVLRRIRGGQSSPALCVLQLPGITPLSPLVVLQTYIVYHPWYSV